MPLKLYPEYYYKRIKDFWLRIRYRENSFIFLNGNQLSKERQQFLENNNKWKKESEHLTIYKLENDIRKTVILNLRDSELFKLDDILIGELFAFRHSRIDYSFLRGELLRCICPLENREYNYGENLLNFYLNNYVEQKDKCLIPQAFLNMYKYVISHIEGNSVLDVGSYNRPFPILLKLKIPDIEITASDINYGYFNCFALKYCKDRNMDIKFRELDILHSPLEKKYDTVTTIHTLEHFEEKDSLLVIKNLLKLVNRRLILVTPFEEFITQMDHRQILNKRKLERIVKRLSLPYRIELISGWDYALIIDIDTR